MVRFTVKEMGGARRMKVDMVGNDHISDLATIVSESWDMKRAVFVSGYRILGDGSVDDCMPDGGRVDVTEFPDILLK